MKRFLSFALCCALLVCSFAVAMAEEVELIPVDREIMIPRLHELQEGLIPSDASGVVEKDGRLAGTVTCPATLWDEEGHEFFGQSAVALTIDAPAPQDFTDEQLAIITAPSMTFSREQLGAAMRSTGQRTWEFNEYAMTRMPFWGSVNSKPLPATMTPDEARENAKQVALDFLHEAGVDGARVLSALRPEDEAAMWALNVIPEQREAERARILREWHTSHRDYTWVQLEFTLHGLVALCQTIDDEGSSISSVANLYIGDAGEMRDAIIVHAPQEIRAAPYEGELRTWREALELYAGVYGSSEENNVFHSTDLRGRETCVWETVITAVEPGYLSADGETYVPAWIITEQRRVVGSGEWITCPSLTAIDARIDR